MLRVIMWPITAVSFVVMLACYCVFFCMDIVFEAIASGGMAAERLMEKLTGGKYTQ